MTAPPLLHRRGSWRTVRIVALAVVAMASGARFVDPLVERWFVGRPDLIAVDGVQTSPRYPGGMALRFARVVRYRPDKTPDQADTVDDVRRLHLG